MRFETRFDRWLVVFLMVSFLATCFVIPTLIFLAPGSALAARCLAFAPLLIWLIVLPNTLPQYYEVREDGLFVRQGWRKSLLPYASLVELQRMSDARSAAVYSTRRILIVTKESQQFLIAVADEARFLTEVAGRCSHLQKRPFGFGLPLSAPTIT